ncbi:hypothetical protein [Gluconobacter sphaericus]|uniref:hypothetical protein n=1 Tax=Gluconobacter sphaericus TaxID=574987 RepID=UPI001B8C20FC|nr:hypothetical protein [Gluconobacter sphaericus]
MAQKGDGSLTVIHCPVPVKEKSGLQIQMPQFASFKVCLFLGDVFHGAGPGSVRKSWAEAFGERAVKCSVMSNHQTGVRGESRHVINRDGLAGQMFGRQPCQILDKVRKWKAPADG